MSKETEIRVCKNKKCQKVLPAGYKHKYCEACRNKHAETAKNVLKGLGAGAATVASVAIVVVNDFYSTNIFSVYPVAKHILSLDIDARLESGDVTLVSDLQKVTINGVEQNFYSFSTKYCSHHKPLEYPIYDSHVEKVLCYFRDRDGFAKFKTPELKDYEKFEGTLIDFRSFYGLDQYNLKEIDKYMWQLGKAYFPKNYGKKKKQEEQK